MESLTLGEERLYFLSSAKGLKSRLQPQDIFLVQERLFNSWSEENKPGKPKKTDSMCLFCFCTFSSLRLFVQWNRSRQVPRGSPITPGAALGTCCRRRRCPPAAYKLLPLQLAAPQCVHVSVSEGPNLGTNNTILCSFPPACHTALFHFFSFFFPFDTQ